MCIFNGLGDLLKGAYMSRINSRRLRQFGVNLIVLTIVITYQACSKNYNVEVQSVGLPPKCRDGKCKTGQMNPDIDVIRPPTKVLFVVDNSRTMSLSQSYLATGVQDMAKDLHGFDADFFIYSTTDQALSSNETNSNLRNDKPVLNSSKLQTCSWKEMVDGKWVDKTGAICPNDKQGLFTSEFINLMNPSLAQGIKFRSTDPMTQLQQSSQNLASAVTSTGIEGSSTETGLCTLVRSVYNEAENKIFKKGDNAALVILSDENDASDPAQCISRETQEETFVGRSAETVDCNPQIEKCNSMDYQVNFATETMQRPYAEVSADFQCNSLTPNSCEVDGSCAKVTYNFTSLRSKIRYSCLNKVDYRLNFNSVSSYSRSLNFSCFSKVPYTIQFNALATYTQNLNYKCEQLDDGVPVSTTVLQSLALNNTVAQCQNGSEVVCDTNSLNLAGSKCTGNSRLLAGSCKLKCVVGSQTVADIIFNDTDSNATQRNLIVNSFTKNSVNYSNLSDWVAKNYPQYTLKTNGIVRGSPDSSSSSPSVLAGLNSSCTNGTTEICNSSQLASAQSSCSSSSKNFMPDSCSVRCNVNTTSPSATFSDNRTDSDLEDLRTHSFVDPQDSQTYSDLTHWAQIKYPNNTISSINRTSVVTGEQETFINENCSSSNTSGVDCVAGSSDFNWADTACGSKKPVICKKKCLGDSKSFYLANSADDKVNFCTNADSNKKFTANTTGATQYSSIQAYANSTTASYQSSATVTACNRVGDGYKPVAASKLVNTTAKNSCDGSYGSVFNLDAQCKGANQNGITSGSLVYSCLEKSSTIELQPALAKTFTYSPKGMENICTVPFDVNGTSYTSLMSYMKTLTGRTDNPYSCVISRASKTVVPAGVVSSAKSVKKWTFPRNVASVDSEANLQKAFIDRSVELFGDNGFFVSAIIRDEIEDSKQKDCAPLSAAQSYGQKYKSLVEAVSKETKAKGELASICASDYSVALSSVSDWIKENARRTLFLSELHEGDEIVALSLVKESTGEEIKLKEKIDYEVVGNKVNFINSSIDPKGWIVKYVYWVPTMIPEF